jgi:hypothetical protein
MQQSKAFAHSIWIQRDLDPSDSEHAHAHVHVLAQDVISKAPSQGAIL